MTPFEEKCQLESDPASNGTYLVYTGLHNVRSASLPPSLPLPPPPSLAPFLLI